MLFGVHKYAWQLVLTAALSVASQAGLLQDAHEPPSSQAFVSIQDEKPTSHSDTATEITDKETPDKETPDKETIDTVTTDDGESLAASQDRSEVESAQPVSAESNASKRESEFDPDEHPLLSKSAPTWIRRGSYREDEVDYRLVSAGPAYLQRMSAAELDDLMVETTAAYIDEQLGPQASRYVKYDLKTVRERFLVPEHCHHDLQKYDVGAMYQSYAQLRFDEPFRVELAQRWRLVRKRQRLIHAGVISAGVFGFLLLGFGYLRLDHATRGFYTGRLQFVGGLAALALLTVEAIALSSVPWL